MTARRSLKELTEAGDPAWPLLRDWIANASIEVEVLPAQEEKRAQALLESQVTLRSPMGALVYHTGGMLIDNGWLRILGSGHSRLPRSLAGWNRERTGPDGQALRFLLIADDVVGGFFALNGGAFGPPNGELFYFAPDALKWEPMNGMGYSDFLRWSLTSRVRSFYERVRWDGWEAEIAALNGNQALSIYPFLWTKEGRNVAQCSRRPCPIEEVFSFHVLQGGNTI